jgi:hypothetical protein
VNCLLSHSVQCNELLSSMPLRSLRAVTVRVTCQFNYLKMKLSFPKMTFITLRYLRLLGFVEPVSLSSPTKMSFLNYMTIANWGTVLVGFALLNLNKADWRKNKYLCSYWRSFGCYSMWVNIPASSWKSSPKMKRQIMPAYRFRYVENVTPFPQPHHSLS